MLRTQASHRRHTVIITYPGSYWSQEVTIMNKQHRKHNWDRLIPEWKASGLSVYSFCRSKGIRPNAMYAALKRRNTTQLFVPVSITPEAEPEKNPDPRAKGTITISIGSATITVEDGFNPELFRSVYQALRDVC